MEFYKILLEIMEEQSLKIADVARLCKLTDSTVRSIITRKNKTVALEVAFKLSKGLNVSLERLNGETQQSTAKSISNTIKDNPPVTTINEKIKWLRKSLSLTQQEMADKLKISRSNIAGYEAGKSEPADAMIALICKEFNVNEHWLRNGTEPIFIVKEEKFNLDDYAQECGASEFDLKLLKAYLGLDKEIRDAIMEQFRKELGNHKGIFKPVTVQEIQESYSAIPNDPSELEKLAVTDTNKNVI